tara:strand:- start:188 stop:1465 length:1278 start_codon:yes stop_codon:yes gene_type:complete
MELSKISETYSLNRLTYINLRWIGILGQLITINVVKFIFDFNFDFISANLIICIGAISNIFLTYYYNKIQLSNQSALNFLLLDIIQLSSLLYLTGGILNPFSIFLLIPSVFASSNLKIKTNLFLISVTLISIIFLTIYSKELPGPLNKIIINNYYYYAIPTGLIIALLFLNYFALIFGKESNLRKEALNKIQELISKEHELVSLGTQAAAAAHSLGTPLSTIKIISQDLLEQLNNNKDLKKDIELLVSQVERCDDILKRLSINSTLDDDFIDKDLNLHIYLKEIVNSFKEISKKNFVINTEQDTNSFQIKKSIEIIYGIRNFIGNANKYAKKNIYITIKSDSEISEIIIEDDGSGFSKDILAKIGEPYIKSLRSNDNKKSGLGLGIFIGKTLLEKNYAKILFRNSETRGGAEIKIEWLNKNLTSI